MIEIMPLKSLNAEINVPGSKYVANRVLIICALADGISVIRNMPDNDDINNSINALREFGVEIEKDKDVKIKGTGGRLEVSKNEIHVGESGTLMRFITAFASLAEGKTRITGSGRIKERPLAELLISLGDLGVESRSNNGNLPIVVQGGSLKGGKTRIRGDISSQFISALLLIAPFAKNDVEIVIESELVSRNYVDMTIDLMKEFGVNVERQGQGFKVMAGQRYKAREFDISGDWSSANYFLAAAAIVPGKVKVNGINQNNLGESGFVDLIAKMGCVMKKNENWIEVEGKNRLAGIDVDMSSMPDSVQTLVSVGIFSNGVTRIKNIGHLHDKESDRIKDTAEEFRKIGVKVEDKDNELEINGGQLKVAVVDPHNDHRLAMSLAVVGLRAGIKIKNPECVNKSFPGFWDKLREIGVEIKDA